MLIGASCNTFDKVKKSNDINLKLTKANEYFEKKKYSQANELYHDLLPVLRGTKNYEQLFYRYAYSFYYLHDYPTASLYFKNFSEYFPTSKDAEECEYMNALCLVKMAPKASLDQTNTIKSMEALQSFINTHQQSSRVSEADTLIEEARRKLEKKDANAAKLYYNIGQYKAATFCYKNIINVYPESPSADFYQFMVVKSNYEYARKSVSDKQAERYASTIEAFKELKEIFPNSAYLKEAAHFELLANNNLKKLK